MSSGTEKRVRDRVLPIRLSAEERALVEVAADRAGLAVGSYARQILLGAPAPRQVRRPPIERRELARLLGELGKIGGNLNQLARAANSGELTFENEVTAVRTDLQVLRDAILKALGREP
jgi:hypothetical protein